MSEEETKPNVDEQIEQFIKSKNSSQLMVKGSILNGAIYNDSSKPKTKWDDLIDFQSDWKSKLKSTIVVYFNELPPRTPLGIKKNYNKNKMIFKKRFQNFSTTILPVFKENRVNLVVTDTYENLQPAIYPFKDSIKIWDFNKATQFFQRMSVKIPQLIDLEEDQVEYKHDDVTYFDNDPHVYLYDILQQFRPIIVKHWERPSLENQMTKDSIAYPRLYMGSYGSCPFKKDIENNGTMINKTNTIKKRYFRDELNKKYALKLKRLYRFHAHFRNRLADDTKINDHELMTAYHDCLDSKKLFDEVEKLKLQRTNTNIKFMSFSEYDRQGNTYNGFNRFPENELVELTEESEDDEKDDKARREHYYQTNRDDNPSSQDTLETELGSDAKLSSLGDFEARTDLKMDINATGFNGWSHVIEPLNIQYCENCHSKFTSLNEHVNSNQHISFVQDISNFIQLDGLLEKLHQ